MTKVVENARVMVLDETDLTDNGAEKGFDSVTIDDFKISRIEVADVDIIGYKCCVGSKILKNRFF
jgi:hypothetical protein